MTLTIQNAYENNSINGNGIYALLVGPAHQLNKVPQFVHIKIGYCHINHAGLIPHDQVVPLFCERLFLRMVGAGRWPNEKIDYVFAVLIYQGSDLPVPDIIQPPACQSKSLACKVPDRRRKIQSSVKPGLHCVLIRRGDIHEVARQQRAQMG